jgi:hypothetical protein
METEKTLAVLKALADGIDPGSGEAFPAGSAYQHPDTVRALFSAIRVLEGAGPSSRQPFSAPGPRTEGSAGRQPGTGRAAGEAGAGRTAAGKPVPGKPASGRPAPENAGRPWSREEDTRLADGFDAGKSFEALAALHKRSKWAVEARLARLGKVPEPASRFPARNAPASTG